jgi:Xaa-Pro aminopeptidase
MLPKNESSQRIACLKSRLVEQGLDGALFTYPVDILYFAGTRQNAALWVPVSGEPMLLVRKSFERARKESAVADVRPFPPSRELPSVFDRKVRHIGLTFDVLPVQHYAFYSGLLSGREFSDISAINRELRAVKSAWELERMSESGRRLVDVFSEIPRFLKPGMRELDLAAELEYRLRYAGSEGRFSMRAFGQDIVGLAAAGETASEPGCFDGPITGRGLSPASPYGPSREIIREHVPIIVDYAGAFEGYMVDMTRIFVFGGLSPEMTNAFAVAAEIQSWLVENLNPGKTCEDLYEGAVMMAEEAGLGKYFMGQAKFVGHGVGLELDELPVLARGFKAVLQTGHTIALEPKFVFPGQGAIGIENTYAVTQIGCERLTVLPDEIVCL